MAINVKTNSSLIKLGAAAGVAAFIIEIAGMILLGLLKPGYSAIISTISELGEAGGVNSHIASAGFILIGICEILFAIAIFFRFKGFSGLIGALLIAGHGLFDSIGSGLFPIDAGGKFESTSGQIHYVVSVIGLILLVFILPFIQKAFANAGLVILRKFTIITAIVILAGTAFFGVSFFTETLIGFSQRIIYFAYFVWILIISIFMIKNLNH